MEEEFRDHISTVNEDGKRIWVYPKKPKGKFTNRRKWVSYSLLIFLLTAPFIKIKGDQLIELNILERKFSIFGATFWPQDLYLFAVILIIFIVFVILFTIIYGRLFCGWFCPQTIFMEFVFRRIEYWIDGDWTQQKALDKQAWNAKKWGKRILKHTIFWLISFVIANIFLAYIIGSDALLKIILEPVHLHTGGLISMGIFTTLFYFVFSRLREQVCTTICPYGRLQGVLLDQNSMVVAYDYVRGEQRSKFRKGEDRPAAKKGDCIDCAQCVHVCPTGIDIRNGTQLECVNCTACIDACDTMMDGVGLEKGLIRFVSENGIKNRSRFQWTTRVISYTVLLVILIGVWITMLAMREDFSTTILRQRGSTFQIDEDNQITNIFEIDLTNKTKETFDVRLRSSEGEVKLQIANERIRLPGEKHVRERFIARFPYKVIEKGTHKIDVIILGNGEEIDRVSIKLIGPSF
ncbi:MAG: cytochrome c oxidase accessory protein CcoG [Fluviicola sp.]|jgi:cytochrome c oxidase accessory protein FixG|uniref:cytochrome c oxidase accessory protein CcoG n=1 Tax=Fluviicola sp. TaxID=1917219 RepID=UPI0026141DB9|nr:cytochrome c oxidase accessory protein CcoG [Fluviicola sp.]MDF3026697.1 cytochrome c oxidase accessory protein CcoG [Fluviicola sp.]